MRRALLSFSLGVFLICSATGRAKAQDLSDVGDLLGGISNAYGSLQAAQFVAALFGLGAGTSVQTAVSELESYMQAYRDQGLVANVAGDVMLYHTISVDYQNGLVDDLEALFINDAVRDLSSLQTAIQDGNMTDAYLLAPAFNLLSVLYPAALKAFGIENPANAFPQSYLDSFLTTAFSVDYPLIGALWVNYDVYGGGIMIYTQGGKTMWPKYAGNFFGGPCTNNGYYFCDNTITSNADFDSFLDCTCFEGDRMRSVISPAALSGTILTAAQTNINNNRNRFIQDPAVQPVITTMASVLSLGLAPEVLDWDNQTFFGFGIGHVVFAL